MNDILRRACLGSSSAALRPTTFLIVIAALLAACQRSASSAFPADAEERLAGFRTDSPPTAADYDNLFAYFVEGWETYRRADGAAADVPGLPSRHGKDVDAFEGFARTAPLVASWLRSGRPARIALSDGRTVDLVAMLSRGILAGTNPHGAGYWGDISDNNQRIVESSDVSLALWLSRDVVWQHFSADEQQRVLGWLGQVDGKQVPDNNWHLFVVFVNAVRAALGGKAEREISLAHYARFKTFYRGGGWFSDGPDNAFDYYNAWAIHYQLFWLNEVDPNWDPTFIESTQRDFLLTYRYLMGPAGLAILGRSVCYRMAAPTPLVFGTARHPEWVPASEARRAVDAVWSYFIGKGAVRQGAVTQGYCGADPRILDNYSGPSSCLWALRSLIPAFYLTPTADFWRGAAGKLAVDTSDYTVPIPSIGWTVTGERATGTIRILHSDSLPTSQTRMEEYGLMLRLKNVVLRRLYRPGNHAAKYRRGVYTSDQPFCGCR